MKANQNKVKMDMRGTYTMPAALQKRLKRLAFETGENESYHVRRALTLYFDSLKKKGATR